MREGGIIVEIRERCVKDPDKTWVEIFGLFPSLMRKPCWAYVVGSIRKEGGRRSFKGMPPQSFQISHRSEWIL
jgi:hypothetical protein